jgi:putative phage-type endonuclease
MNDDERAAWLAQRRGKLTGSRMADAAAFKRDGTPAAVRRDYLYSLAAERLTGYTAPNFVSRAMQWGIDQEPNARDAFELVTGALVMPCGFVDHPTIPGFGATPDGLIRDDELVEFKCPETATHIGWILAGAGVPAEHRPQILAELAVTGRRRAWFASFDPRLPAALQLFVVAWEPSPEEIAAVERAAVDFLRELDALLATLTAAELVPA